MLGALRAALPAALLVVGLIGGCGAAGRSAAQQAVVPAAPASAPLGGPVPAGAVVPLGAPAYDGRRDLAWVTLTARDEVVGLGVAGGEPVIVHRFPTVHQPNAVAVDPVSGRVLVVSASGAGLQVIDPERVVQ